VDEAERGASMMKIRGPARVVVSILFLVLPSLLRGNGVYIPPVDTPAMPSIPVQRAMICYRDGVETLIVESTFQTPAKDAGWILPLPAAPTKLLKADEAMLESVTTALQPDIVSNKHAVMIASIWVLFMALLAAAHIRKHGMTSRVAAEIVAMVLFVLVFRAMILSSSREPTASTATLIRSTRVGSYDAAILRAKRADELNDWLVANHLKPLDAAARGVFDAYCREGWCFVVARLRQDDASKPAAPHPIAATFPWSAPVFPMRATQLAGSKTAVELVVVADRKASASGFTCVAADQFNPANPPRSSDAVGDLVPGYAAKSVKLSIGHPDAAEYLWPGCVVTRLSAQLKPAAMDHDVELSLSPLTAPVWQRVYASRARWELIIAVLLMGLSTLAVCHALVYQKGRQPPPRERKMLRDLLPIAVLAAVAVYLFMPVIPVVEQGWYERLQQGVNSNSQVKAANDAVQSHLIDRSTLTRPAELPTWLGLSDAPEFSTNVFTNQPITLRRSRGNYSVRDVDGASYLCLYDINDHEIRLPLKLVPTTREGPR
jgi:hypothetical protein